MAVNPTKHTQWKARQRAAHRRPLTVWLPQGQTTMLTELARRHRLSQSVLLELAIAQGLQSGGVLTVPPLRAQLLLAERHVRQSLATRPRTPRAQAPPNPVGPPAADQSLAT